MGSDVLIDSNVYIDLLKMRKDPVATLYEWGEARDRNLAICGMIRVEVLRGLKLLKVYHSISAIMDVMINLPSDNRMWTDATELAWSLDRKGIIIPGADAVIAASALRHGAAVMTSDAHFSKIEGLRVIPLPDEWFGR
ncbi:MAG: PIN domain-containing protein [Akkermansiaceae bacterium]